MFERRPSAIALGLTLTALASGAANAQTTEPTLPEVRSTDSAPRAGSPRDTVTTGSKTDTAIRDLPASVIVVPAETLEEQGARTMNQALENVSGVQPQMAGGYGFADNYSVRGLAMRWLRDGLPDGPTQNGYLRTVFDIERIEVLKGPGSALYGAGQPGGTVNVVTRKPQFSHAAELTGQFGSFGSKAGSLDLTGPLTENLAARLIVNHDERDGWRGLSRQINEFLPSLTWKIANDKVLNIDYDHREIKAKPDNYGILFDSRGKLANVSPETRYYSPLNQTDQTIDRLSVSHDWSLSEGLTLRTAMVADQRDLDMIRNAGANGGNAAGAITGRTLRLQKDHIRYTTFQNELTWKTRAGHLEQTVLAGVEYSSTRIDTVRVGYNLPSISNILSPVVLESSINALGAPVSSQGFNRSLGADIWGVYLQDQVALGESFKIRAGMRSDQTRFSDVGMQGTSYREIRESKSLPSGSLGAVWQPTREVSIYAGLSSGQFVNLATEAAAIGSAPEKARQKEIGVKAALLDNKLGLNLAFFDTQRENYYITLPGALVATPDGKDKSRGAEFDITAEPLRGLNLLANYVVQNPEVTSNAMATNAAMGVTTPRSIAGTLPTGVARQSGRLWTSYTLQSGELRGLGFGLGATHKGESYADSLNLYRVPAYTVFDAAIFYRQPKWEMSLSMKNLTNRTYYVSPTFVGALPGEARNAMLTVKYRI